MASALIIPGVQVKTEFEPAPVLLGATGILGVVGVTDRGPTTPTPVGNFGEFIELFGPASATPCRKYAKPLPMAYRAR
ncbi:MAG: hypothetical protein JWM78_2128 [Verrucomicrobiaceae bacterium]|nr:hypothetical protein [Verrucomicrobiaceae bacterium]